MAKKGTFKLRSGNSSSAKTQLSENKKRPTQSKSQLISSSSHKKDDELSNQEKILEDETELSEKQDAGEVKTQDYNSDDDESNGDLDMHDESEDDDSSDEEMKDEFEVSEGEEHESENESDSHDEEGGNPEDDLDDEEEIKQMKRARKAKKQKLKLSDAMNFILESNIKKSDVSAPILSKSKAISRQIEQEKIQYRARKILAAERKSKLNKDRVLPDVRELDYERRLRKVATRGVVKLFNAIKTAQSKSMSELNNSGIVVTSSTKAKVANISKSTFFELLKKQSSATSFNPNKPLPPPSSTSFNSTSEFSSGISSDSISKSISPSPNNTVAQTQNQDKPGETKTPKGWSVLSEGYLMDSRLQGWDQAEEMDL